MIVTHKMNADLLRPGVEARVNAVQGDKNTRAVEISLAVGGNAFTIPSGTAAVVRFRKDDGTGGVYNKLPDGSTAYKVSGNKVTVTLAPAVLSTAGYVTASVALSNSGDVLGVFSFRILVEPDPSVGTVESENYFSFETLEDINTALAGFESAIEGRVSKAGDAVSGYLNFGTNTAGLKWTTSDGTQILLRPDYENNVFQIVKKGESDTSWHSVLTIGTDGTPKFPTKPLGIASGGTDAKTAAAARNNLGITPLNIGAIPADGGDVTGYLNFGAATRGLKWTTSDGTQILLRPDYENNVFQIVKKGESDTSWYSILTIGTDGTPQFPTKPLGIASGGIGAATAAEGLLNLTAGGTFAGDFDSNTNPGVYWCNLSECTNGPAGTGYGYLEVLKHTAGNQVIQRFTFYSNGATVVRFYVNQKWYAWDNGHFKLLWENASPSSEFASQTATVSTANYDRFLVVCAVTNSLGAYVTTVVEKGKRFQVMLGTGKNFLRYIAISDTTISFSDTKMYSTYGDYTEGTANGTLVPVAVYGMK